jgi:hypothetical protein
MTLLKVVPNVLSGLQLCHCRQNTKHWLQQGFVTFCNVNSAVWTFTIYGFATRLHLSTAAFRQSHNKQSF